MPQELGRDSEVTTYQEVDPRKRNSRLCVLIQSGWSAHSIQKIERIDTSPNMFGWQVTY